MRDGTQIVAQRFDHRGIDRASALCLRCHLLPAAKLLFGFLEPLHREVDRLAVVGHQHGQAQHFAGPGPATELSVSSRSLMVTKLPSDFDIFWPSTCKKPLCIQ